jgi:ATP-dependent exoDNAse (exonuclease V) beta subunit
LQEVYYDTERDLLYVACTRARDHLLVTGVSEIAPLPDDARARSWPLSRSRPGPCVL